jgi:hypothetical protein
VVYKAIQCHHGHCFAALVVTCGVMVRSSVSQSPEPSEGNEATSLRHDAVRRTGIRQLLTCPAT